MIRLLNIIFLIYRRAQLESIKAELEKISPKSAKSFNPKNKQSCKDHKTFFQITKVDQKQIPKNHKVNEIDENIIKKPKPTKVAKKSKIP